VTLCLSVWSLVQSDLTLVFVQHCYLGKILTVIIIMVIVIIINKKFLLCCLAVFFFN